MTQTQTKEDILLFAAMNEEPAWLTEKRINALDQWQTLPFPVIEKVSFHRWALSDQAIVAPYGDELYLAQQHLFHDHDRPKIVQYGRETLLEQMPQELLEKGVIFTDMFTAAKDHPELVEKYFMTQAVLPEENRLTAYHMGHLSSGIFLYVPRNVEIEVPLEALHIQNSHVKEALTKHVLIVAEANSSVSVVEKFQTEGTEVNSASVIVEVITKPGARVRYSAVDHFGDQTAAYINRRGHLGKDSSIEWAIGVMNNGNAVYDFASNLHGDGSSSIVKAVAISTGRQIQGLDTRVTNYGKHSVGHILQHGVILDRSSLTFNGIGHIIKGAKGADAQQESRVLMLSEGARGDANPILLIDENEVTAGHAASVGRVDEEELFYMLSRGIEREEAERLVIRGFLGTVIAAIPVKETRDELIAVIDEKLRKAR